MWPFRPSVKRKESLETRLRRSVDRTQFLFAAVSFAAIFFYKFDPLPEVGLAEVSIFEPARALDVVLRENVWRRLLNFALGNATPLSLFFLTLLWFHRYRAAVMNEITILSALFTKLDLPDEDDFRRLVGANYIDIIAFGLAIAFLFLAFFADRPAIYALVSLILLLQDLNGNRLVQRNLARILSGSFARYAAASPEHDLVQRRRDVARAYWIERPHLERVALMIIGVSVALAIANAEATLGASLPAWIAVAMIAAVVATNEIVIAWWRHLRDAEFARIEDEFDARATSIQSQVVEDSISSPSLAGDRG